MMVWMETSGVLCEEVSCHAASRVDEETCKLGVGELKSRQKMGSV